MSRDALLVLCLASQAVFCQTPGKKGAVPGVPATAAPAESALNKATLEAYVRHLFVWGKAINIEVLDPTPSKDLPGFLEIVVRASAGQVSQDETFLVSKDGRKIVRGSVFDVSQNPFKADLDRLKTESQPSMGTDGAPVVLVIFTDFECPFCKQEANMLRQNLLSAYPKEVHLYFKDFPLVPMHPWAKTAAIAGRCIYHQNAAAFWGFHDWVYGQQSDITADNFKDKLFEFIKGKEIDAMQLGSCLDTKATEAEVDRSMAQGKELHVTSTPTMFINGRRIEGQLPWPSLRDIIDFEIEYQKTAKNAGEDCGCEVKLPTPFGAKGPAQ